MSYEIENLYVFDDKDSVINYLKDKPDFIDFLIEFYHEITFVFKNHIYVKLSLCKTWHDDFGMIACVYVDTSISVGEALRKIDMIDAWWFSDNMHKINYYFNYDVEWLWER